MLKKCLKYDLQAVTRIWWILAVTMMGAALVAALSLRALFQVMLDPDPAGFLVLLSVFGTLGAGLCVFAMAACMTVSVILVYWRTYTHFYSGEGYLTFTLPVKRSTLYLSKVLTAAIVTTATTLIFIAGVALILLIAPASEGNGIINPVVYTHLFEFFDMAWEYTGAWMILWVAVLLPMPFLVHLFSSGMVFLCITVGSVIAKKHKLLAAIGIYYGVTMVLSFVGQFISYFLSGGMIGIVVAAAEGGLTITGVTVTAILLVVDLVIACLAAVTHFISVHLVEHKLNLA
jgi:hypothetical protein